MKVELEIISDRLPTEADGKDGKWVLALIDGVWWAIAWNSVTKGTPWMRQPPPPKPPIDTSLAASVDRFTGWLENAIFDEPLGSDCIAVRDAARKWDEYENERLDAMAADYAEHDQYSIGHNPHKISTDTDDANQSYKSPPGKLIGKCKLVPDNDHDESHCLRGVPGCVINHLADNGEGPCVKPLPEVSRADNDPDGVGEGWRKLKWNERTKPGDECRLITKPDDEWSPSLNATFEGEQSTSCVYRRRITSDDAQPRQ